MKLSFGVLAAFAHGFVCFLLFSALRRDEGFPLIDVNLRGTGSGYGGNVNKPHIS